MVSGTASEQMTVPAFADVHLNGWNNRVSPAQPVVTLFSECVGSDLIGLQRLLHVSHSLHDFSTKKPKQTPISI